MENKKTNVSSFQKLNIRIIQSMLSLFMGIYFFIIFLGNITDYNANYFFVKNVLSMKEVFNPENNAWRSITNSTMHKIMYNFIILTECVCCFLFIFGFLKMLKNIHTPNFIKQKQATLIAYFITLTLFFLGFICIAGEYFLMWQAKSYNAQPTAFMVTLIAATFLIIHLHETYEF
ncbi:MAG: DUF2165 domain-containing protein [Alphaproteobacteria bacterium]|nr:DUF2165 domain-containing protein [Alphaproteobacteria bacterium]